MTTSLSAKTVLSNTAINSKPVTAVVAGQPTTINATKPVQNQGTADTDPRSGNPPQGLEGPSPNLAGVSKTSTDSFAPQSSADKQASLNQSLGLVNQNAALQSLSGLGTSAPTSQSQREKLTDLQGSIGTNQSPGFDQGFDNKPSNLGGNTMTSETTGAMSSIAGSENSSNSATGMVAGGGTAFNPMDVFSGGSVGGPLGAAAAAGTKSLADMGKDGLISIQSDDAAKAGKAAGALAGGAAFVETVTAGTTAATIKEIVEVSRLGFSSSFLTPGLTVAGSTAAVLGAFAAGVGVGTVLNDAATVGLSAITRQENYTLGDLVYDLVNPDDQASPATPPAGGGAGIPDPDTHGVKVNIVTGTLLEQIQAAQAGKPVTQGGSGDATPVTEGGSDPVVRNGGIAANQSSVQGRNLFGQPVNPAGENVSGGNKGLQDFSGSNGAGVINPGNDAGSTAGDPRFQQDPAKALGDNKPAATGPSLPATPSSPSEQTSSVSTTLAAGVQNLTLTGTAAINGSGNALDNWIKGNAAANELRGGAGQDNLDGQGGNDLLDGGNGLDRLTGGTGADRFRFASAGNFAASQADRITDFNRSEGDRIEISRSAFGLTADALLSVQVVSTEADLNRALGSSTLLIQDLRDGSLLFNQNGIIAGVGQGGPFAQVGQGLSLQSSDFALVA